MDARIFKGSAHIGTKTASAGTAFIGVIPPKAQAYTKIARASYRVGANAHVISFLKAQGKTTTTAAAAAADTTLTLASINPATDENGASLSENLAANDWIVVQHTDGTWGAYMVASVSGLVVTLSTVAPAVDLDKAVASGATVYAMHELARVTGKNSVQITTSTSTVQTYETYDPAVGVVSSPGVNQPILIHSNNVTAQGWLEYVAAVYTKI